MISFIIKRLGWMLLAIWVVFTASFVLMRSVPGGPFSSERALAPEIEANINRRYHLDQPIWVQYGYELLNVLRGDLGHSFKLADFQVKEIILSGLPISVTLGIFAMGYALAVGLTAGIVSAVARGGILDVTLRLLATVGIALPLFVVASVTVLMFVFVLPWFPAAGWGQIRQIILPAVCLGSPYAAYIARLSRSAMLDVLNQDYIRTAKAKGLSSLAVVMRHGLKGAMLPVVSFMGPASAGILTGSMVVEKIFAIPGLGVHFVNAALQRDYTLAMGMILVFTTLLMTLNLLVDLSYTVLDPRVKLE